MKYPEIIYWDIISPIAGQFGPNGFFFRPDGKIDYHREIKVGSPWIHTKPGWNRRCGLWHNIMFDCYSLLPSNCLNCWKVVVRPRNVAELFKLKDLQEEMNVSSKCGVEPRKTVNANYGGYFYNDSYEQGIFCYNKVRKLIDDRLSKETDVILKRGCTEFEHHFGPSSQWEKMITPTHRKLEELISNSFYHGDEATIQPVTLKAFIMRNWLKYAYSKGDMSYKEITGNLIPVSEAKPLETYHLPPPPGKKPPPVDGKRKKPKKK
jgi:hypothetical protein